MFLGFYSSSVSKVNEYMPTPLTLSCFCEECLEVEEPPHNYALYAIIMHLGAAIASGHYVAYVRTLENVAQEYLYCTHDKPKTSSLSRGCSINSGAGATGGGTTTTTTMTTTASSATSNGTSDKGIFRYLNKLSSKSFSNGSSSSASGGGGGKGGDSAMAIGNGGGGSSSDLLRGGGGEHHRVKPTCKGSDCCSVRARGAFSPSDSEYSSTVWLECDDESVRPMSVNEVVEMLSPKSNKNSGVTPYLLFYTRVDS